MHKYVEENKEKYINTKLCHQASTLINDIKNDLDLNLSYNGALTLLRKHCNRPIREARSKGLSKDSKRS